MAGRKRRRRIQMAGLASALLVAAIAAGCTKSEETESNPEPEQ
ncbi:hypothetical protein PCCS19_34080 [Paenibacillus sp. CCS19]|nr:hypothetical protein [Paenibacillus cellulosilyticus]GMK40352.1 hypothetical protein PCCS19_34080 [Paenibacillus cellulosilyticus]